jgi:predicted Holliday junction resolvase-like endonuclease
MVSLTWSQVGTLIGALVVVMGAFAYHMDKRFDALQNQMNHRFDDLKDWVRAELRRIDERLDSLTERITKIEEKLEQRTPTR